MARDLAAFFKIANVINSTRDVQALERELLELICEVIPAAQAAIVLEQNPNDEPIPSCTWNRKGLATQQIVIREELVRQATWERCAVVAAAPAATTSADMCCAYPWSRSREPWG